VKGLRKAAIRLSAATMTGLDFYLNMPMREFVELNNEVVKEWQATKH
jgi:hypothetical protein